MPTVKNNKRNIYDDLGVTAGKVKGGYRGKRAGKKAQAAKQARKSSITVNSKAQSNMYGAKNLSSTKETGMLLRTLAKECTGRHQSSKGTIQIKNVDSKTKKGTVTNDSNTMYHESQHLNDDTQSTMDEPQNLVNLSKGASLQANGKEYRGTRAGKVVKMQQNCTKVAMLLSALSSECSKTDFFV